MPKALLSTTLFLLLSSGLFAQNHRFADSTSQWNILIRQSYFCHCASWNTHIYNVTGDTVLNNHTYQVVSYSNQHTIFPVQPNGQYYIRRDTTGKVYGLTNTDSAEYLVYNFNKQAGDTFTIKLPVPTGWTNTIKVRIDSTANVFNGLNRKVQYVTLFAISQVNDVFVEGIGAINGFFAAPGIEYTVYDGPDYNLLCFSEQSNLVYHRPNYNTCVLDSFWMGINSTEVNNIQVYPNPASNTVYIKTDDNLPQQATFILSDLTGRAILQQPVTGKQTAIDITGIANGAYIYHIKTDNNLAYSGKLYKQ